MIKLQRLNVVKLVESEEKAQALVRQGFKRILEPEIKEVNPEPGPDQEPEVTKKRGGK